MMAGMILISFLLLGAAFITLSYQYTVQEKRGAMERNASYISQFTSAIISSGMSIYDDGYRLYISSLAGISDAYVILCENDGEIVYSSVPSEE